MRGREFGELLTKKGSSECFIWGGELPDKKGEE